jgi:hypothetical protein
MYVPLRLQNEVKGQEFRYDWPERTPGKTCSVKSVWELCTRSYINATTYVTVQYTASTLFQWLSCRLMAVPVVHVLLKFCPLKPLPPLRWLSCGSYRRVDCLHQQGTESLSVLMMEAASISETSRCNNLKDSHLRTRLCENLKSH